MLTYILIAKIVLSPFGITKIKNGPVDLAWNVFRKKHKVITKNIGKLALLEQG